MALISALSKGSPFVGCVPEPWPVFREAAMRIQKPEDLPWVRHQVQCIASSCGVNQDKLPDLIGAVNEAMNNAMYHGKRHVFVSCYLHEDEKKWFGVRVEDNGNGIPADRLEYVLAANMPGPDAPSGRGSALVKLYIQGMGGRYSIDTQTEGPCTGTVVYLEVPLK